MANRDCVCIKCSSNFQINSRNLIRKYCFICRPEQLKLNFDLCKEKAELCESRWQFQKEYPRYYNISRKRGWLETVCKHMPDPQYTYTYNDCKEKALLCKSKTEFNERFKSHSNAMYRNKWLDICDHMLSALGGGFTRTSFLKNCELKNNSIGILYMLRCYDEFENFYKIGITSTGSVKRRYSNGGDLPYKYEILWILEDEPGLIWDLELFFKRAIKTKAYTPKKWKCSKSVECFICDENSNLILKPSSHSLK